MVRLRQRSYQEIQIVGLNRIQWYGIQPYRSIEVGDPIAHSVVVYNKVAPQSTIGSNTDQMSLLSVFVICSLVKDPLVGETSHGFQVLTKLIPQRLQDLFEIVIVIG